MNNDPVPDNTASDDESDDGDVAQNYVPISYYEGNDLESLGGTDNHLHTGTGGNFVNHSSPNVKFVHLHAENGISALHLNDCSTSAGSEEEEEEEEEEKEEEEATEREREESIMRAFREDERRRSAPLTSENAARILSAMRGISFPDYTPDWLDRMPEDSWVDQLRRLRGESASQS